MSDVRLKYIMCIIQSNWFIYVLQVVCGVRCARNKYFQ